ncbi:hypothetical protein CONLIGDRAFT_692514 [Coniochaeta ligniaria NRRL 30616]|uniref:Uncharacterized protein n=1 Tax=Coniochaeta ligniaria NRRL 30616 TaxID=1408157 RepID=A0A1J7IA67_9PEZI|nr:hypothetical protein CONLIGDRAFT_692514 [Coniochaeta ligniaria NRRL 30616]
MSSIKASSPSPPPSSPDACNADRATVAADAEQESVAVPLQIVTLTDRTVSTSGDPPRSPLSPVKAPEKRKRGQEGLEIVTELEAIKEQEDLSPETISIADQIINRARVFVENSDDLDVEGVALSFDVFKKLRKVQKANPADQANTLRFFMDIGDWAAAIVNNVKSQEKTIREDMKQSLAKSLSQTNPDLNLNKRQKMAQEMPECRWKALSGHRADQMKSNLDQDLQSVRTWRLAGGSAATAPQTPHLDRVLSACKHAHVEYEVFMKALSISEERNEIAHHPPPLVRDHINLDNTVNWASVELAFEESKRRVRETRANGFLNDKQLGDFLTIIDGTFKTFRTVDAKGKVIETEKTMEIVGGVKNARRAADNAPVLPPPAPPISPYQAGKWDAVPK